MDGRSGASQRSTDEKGSINAKTALREQKRFSIKLNNSQKEITTWNS